MFDSSTLEIGNRILSSRSHLELIARKIQKYPAIKIVWKRHYRQRGRMVNAGNAGNCRSADTYLVFPTCYLFNNKINHLLI